MASPTLIYYQILHYRPENMDLLTRHFHVITLPDPSVDKPEILREADVILVPLGYFLGKEKMDLSPRLKVIGSNTTGHPHIDVDYARKKGIEVVTLKNQHDFLRTITPTAELTWGLIIALTRNLVPAFHSVLEGRWERWPFGGERMLSRMTLGIVGLGRLGGMVASYGVSFGMRVCYYDPYVDESAMDVARAETLGELVETSDIISIHIPHEPETENLFGREVFSRFKHGAYFINTSRGEVIDEQALLECLERGNLAGAAVDVLAGEFEPGFDRRVHEQPLVKYAAEHSNLIITPHIGGSTVDAWGLTQEYTVRKVIEALDLSQKTRVSGRR
jgi:D-3-phosphoglycerate dehydrogenase